MQKCRFRLFVTLSDVKSVHEESYASPKTVSTLQRRVIFVRWDLIIQLGFIENLFDHRCSPEKSHLKKAKIKYSLLCSAHRSYLLVSCCRSGLWHRAPRAHSYHYKETHKKGEGGFIFWTVVVFWLELAKWAKTLARYAINVSGHETMAGFTLKVVMPDSHWFLFLFCSFTSGFLSSFRSDTYLKSAPTPANPQPWEENNRVQNLVSNIFRWNEMRPNGN